MRAATVRAAFGAALLSGREGLERPKRAVEELGAYLRELLAARRHAPRDDLLTAMSEAEEGGESPLEGELVALASLLLAAGNETTSSLIGNAVLLLLRNPQERKRLQDDLSLLPARSKSACASSLRYSSPTAPSSSRWSSPGCGSSRARSSPCSSLRPTAIPPTSATRSASTSAAATTATSPSASATTSAWARHSRAWKRRWRSEPSCGAFRISRARRTRRRGSHPSWCAVRRLFGYGSALAEPSKPPELPPQRQRHDDRQLREGTPSLSERLYGRACCRSQSYRSGDPYPRSHVPPWSRSR